MAEACDAGSEGTAHVCIDESHLGSLVEILVVHVVDEVQGLHIYACQPVHHIHEARQELLVCQHVAFYWTVCRSTLLAGLGVYTTADGIGKTLGKVCPGTEELHLLTSLSCGHAAADAVVVAPHWAHNVVVFVLDAARFHRNHCRKLLEVLGQSAAIEHR